MLWYTAPNRELAKADANSVIWRERERERGEELYNQHLHAVAGQQSPNEPTINKKIFSFNQLTEKKKKRDRQRSERERRKARYEYVQKM